MNSAQVKHRTLHPTNYRRALNACLNRSYSIHALQHSVQGECHDGERSPEIFDDQLEAIGKQTEGTDGLFWYVSLLVFRTDLVFKS
jgi:hypothetical protein